MDRILVSTSAREQMVRITQPVQELAARRGWLDGVIHLYCPHTSAAVTVNEAADPDVMRDFLSNMARLLPRDRGYLHTDGNADAHIKSSVIGPNVQVFVEHGQLMLGSWQGLYFCEFDGPRTREVWIKFIT